MRLVWKSSTNKHCDPDATPGVWGGGGGGCCLGSSSEQVSQICYKHIGTKLPLLKGELGTIRKERKDSSEHKWNGGGFCCCSPAATGAERVESRATCVTLVPRHASAAARASPLAVALQAHRAWTTGAARACVCVGGGGGGAVMAERHKERENGEP